MAAMSDYLETNLRTLIFRTGAGFAKTAGLYVALFTAAPSDSGGGTEVSGGSYARVNVPPLDANWTAPDGTGGLTANAATVTFPTATANWGTITHVGIFDAATAGNLLFHGALSASKVVNNGDTFSFAVGALSVTLA
jgi:hypothetical protein